MVTIAPIKMLISVILLDPGPIASIGHEQQASTSRASTKRMLRPKDDKDNKGKGGTMKLSPSRNQEVVRRDVTMKRLPRGCAITKYRSHQSKNWLVVYLPL